MRKILIIFLLLLAACQSANVAPVQTVASKCWVLSWQFNRLLVIWYSAPIEAKDYKASFYIIDQTGIAITDNTDSWRSVEGAVIMQKDAGFWGQLWRMNGLTCQADYKSSTLISETNPTTFVGNFLGIHTSIFYFPLIPNRRTQ